MKNELSDLFLKKKPYVGKLGERNCGRFAAMEPKCYPATDAANNNHKNYESSRPILKVPAVQKAGSPGLS
jgi:hypothetical protein